MATKRRKTEKHKRVDPRALELLSAKASQLLQSHNFASDSEANEFLKSNAMGSALEETAYVAETPIEKAQHVMWKAFDESSTKKRVAMAQEALAICADCADAYVLLAEDSARSLDEEINYYRKGVEAGKRALGEEIFKSTDVEWWSELRTRPYMRAVNGLAGALFADKQIEAAISLWLELIKLDSEDKLSVRLLLVPAMVEANQFTEAESIMNKYPDEFGAHMRYSRALMTFRRHGDCDTTSATLEEAAVQNSNVLDFLFGFRRLPSGPIPSTFTAGSPEEALAYLEIAGRSWDKPEIGEWIIEFAKRHIKQNQLEKTFPGLVSGQPNIVELFPADKPER